MGWVRGPDRGWKRRKVGVKVLGKNVRGKKIGQKVRVTHKEGLQEVMSKNKSTSR